MVISLAIQCVVVSIVLRFFIHLEKKKAIRPTLLTGSLLLIVAMLAMLGGILVQVTVWAGLFWGCGEFATFRTAFYHSVVNFTSLGYGDIVMSEERRLLGALEATNGILILGLTTAFLYSVIDTLIAQVWLTELPSPPTASEHTD